MTDREYLELAAKACGMTVQEALQKLGKPISLYSEWNPLYDDGDALRLAKARKMTVAWEPSRGGWSVGAIVDGEFRWLAFDVDCNRAIVRAAAEIGKGMA
jgi:hypothetical protein